MDGHLIYNIPRIMDHACTIYSPRDIMDGHLIYNIPLDYGLRLCDL